MIKLLDPGQFFRIINRMEMFSDSIVNGPEFSFIFDAKELTDPVLFKLRNGNNDIAFLHYPWYD